MAVATSINLSLAMTAPSKSPGRIASPNFSFSPANGPVSSATGAAAALAAIDHLLSLRGLGHRLSLGFAHLADFQRASRIDQVGPQHGNGNRLNRGLAIPGDIADALALDLLKQFQKAVQHGFRLGG